MAGWVKSGPTSSSFRRLVSRCCWPPACGAGPRALRRPPAGDRARQRGGSLTASLRREPVDLQPPWARRATRPPSTPSRGLTHAPLVRINRVTDQPEPWLAETVDRLARRPHHHADAARRRDLLRRRAVHRRTTSCSRSRRSTTRRSNSVLATGVLVASTSRSSVTAPDPRTVVVTMPAPFAPGVAMLDNVPIYPKHLLQAALDAGTLRARRGASTTPPAQMAGLGPFMLAEYVPGQRLTFTRNPHYWRKDAAGVPAAVPRSARRRVREDAGRRDAAPAGRLDRPDDAGRRARRKTSRRCASCATRARVQLVDAGSRRRSQRALVQPHAGGDRAGPEGQAVSRAHGVPPGDLVRRRSRRDRQHALPRRRGAGLRPGDAGQPHVVFGRRADVSATTSRARRRCSPASA